MRVHVSKPWSEPCVELRRCAMEILAHRACPPSVFTYGLEVYVQIKQRLPCDCTALAADEAEGAVTHAFKANRQATAVSIQANFHAEQPSYRGGGPASAPPPAAPTRRRRAHIDQPNNYNHACSQQFVDVPSHAMLLQRFAVAHGSCISTAPTAAWIIAIIAAVSSSDAC